MTQITAELIADASGGGLMEIVSGPGVRTQIPRLVAQLAPAGEIVVLSDSREKTVEGTDVLTSVLGGLGAQRIVRLVSAPEGIHGLVLDEETVAKAAAETAGAALLVSVGSGTISDLGKAAAQRNAMPLVAVQTAASVNGYSDPLSVLVINGAKRTQQTVWPSALVIDHEILKAAPSRLTTAGVGDAVAVWTAAADWYLACGLGMDSDYDATVIEPVMEAAQALRASAADGSHDLGQVVETLTLGGLAIGRAGSTAPLSGCEHLISHVLDMAAMAKGAGHDLHGAQVGVATVVAAALWDVALEELDILGLDPNTLAFPADMEARVAATWEPVDPSGKLGAECWAAVQKKIERWNQARGGVTAFFNDAQRHRPMLRTLAASPEVPAKTLHFWGGPARFRDLTPRVDAAQARWALSSLPYMRDRMTLADLLVTAGLWDEALFDRVLARAAAAGGGI